MKAETNDIVSSVMVFNPLRVAGRSRPPMVVLCVQNLPVPRDPRVWREARALADAGYRVAVVSPGGQGLPRQDLLEGVRILRYPPAPTLDGMPGLIVETVACLFWTAVMVGQLRLRGRVSVIHAANPPDAFFLVALLFRPLGVRFVYDQHDPVPELFEAKFGRHSLLERLFCWLESRSLAAADLVLVTNETMRNRAVERRRRQPCEVVVVRNGPDRVREPLPPPANSRATVVFAGSVTSQSGLRDVIDAFARLTARRPGIARLEILGGGDALAELQDTCRELGIASQVDWTGWLEGEVLTDRIRRATVAVAPGDNTRFYRLLTSAKVAEYLAAGVPAVVADLPENHATAREAAFYFRPGDPADLARCLELLLDDPALRKRLSVRALDRAPQLLWQHSAERLRDAYGVLAGATRDGVPFVKEVLL